MCIRYNWLNLIRVKWKPKKGVNYAHNTIEVERRKGSVKNKWNVTQNKETEVNENL